jgi:hypothetical protein
MRKVLAAIALALAVGCSKSQAVVAVPELAPYPFPTKVQDSLATLGGECDVFVIGETHGTQEVPAIVEALLEPLTKLGYRALAVEIPHDQQSAIVAWATGESTIVPEFFAQPGADGRGNAQLLALLRSALRPPYEWKLICFDQTETEMLRQVMERLPKDSHGSIGEQAAKLSPTDFVALAVGRDLAMAEQLAAGKNELPADTTVLAICGSFHARIADHSPDDSPVKPLWPSLAAEIASKHPEWRLKSLNVQPFGGEYFNGGKVNSFGKRPLKQVEFRLLTDDDYDAELNIPKATVATFLATPPTMEQEGARAAEKSGHD